MIVLEEKNGKNWIEEWLLEQKDVELEICNFSLFFSIMRGRMGAPSAVDGVTSPRW